MEPAAYSEIQRTNTRLKQLIANLDGGVLVEDETRHIDLVNQQFCDMFNIDAPPAALFGADCSDSAEQSKHLLVDPAGFVRRIHELLRGDEAAKGDVLHMVDGRVLSRNYLPIFDDHGTKIGHLWHYHDITEQVRSQRRMERLLRFEEVNREIIRLFLQLENVDAVVNEVLAMTGHLLDVSRVYIFRFRENERILDNTHEWCAYGVKPEIDNLQGLPFDTIMPSFFPLIAEKDLIAPHHISELPDDLRGMLEPQDIKSILWLPMYLGNRIEGFIGYDETRYARHWLPEEITMARIIIESYTRALEREQTAHLMVVARDEAVRTAQLRAQFVANMSHEIRTPMTGTLGMLELLLETELDDLQQEFASEALNSSSRLLTIINDILDFSKLDAGQITLEATPIDLKAIMTEVKMTLMPQISDKPVSISFDINPDLPHKVFGDPTRIRQVLMNLVSNAVKFTHQGDVTIQAKVAEMMLDTAFIRFSVTDTGVGIPADKQHHVFDSFTQADGSTTRRYGGSGLGLSISKQLVELMGGQINMTSEVGVGSTFWFTLNLPIAQEAGPNHNDKADFAHIKALLIDDNRTVRYVLAQQLENWGVQVTQIDYIDGVDAFTAGYECDLIFIRHSKSAEDDIARLVSISPQIIYLQEAGQAPPTDERLALAWPIDQSSLYNVLILAVRSELQQPTEPTPDPEIVRGRVLLADDYPINIDLVRRALAGIQVTVDAVENGKELLEQLPQADYDLILMDIQMPIMDGVTATQHIRNAGETYQHIPIIALTASVMQNEQNHYLEIGMDDIISKPFSVRHIREVVNQWLERLKTTPALTDAS